MGVSGHWPLADYAKRNMLQAVSFISDFETAAQRGLDCVIRGHIHTAAIRRIDNVTYINCGNWVDSCTAVVEHMTGAWNWCAWSRRSRR